MGFAVLESGPPVTHITSGVVGVDRGEKEAYQAFRLRLIEYWVVEATQMFETWTPDVVVSEIIPVKGGGQFIAAAQSQLAATAITVIQALADIAGYKVVQIGATTVKTTVAGSGKASKIAVRNKVWQTFPHLTIRASDWVIDQSDAIAVGLSYISSIK